MPLERSRPMHPLEGVIWKLRWAEKHIETIESLSKTFEALHPYSMISNLDADQAYHECRLIALFPPFTDYPREIGECVYQLRSALDHIVYALSAFPDGLNEQERESAERTPMFRIFTVRNESAIRSGLKYVPNNIRESVWKAIDRLQPYQNDDKADHHLLAILEGISNLDKHRLVNPTGAVLRVNRINLSPGVEIYGGSTNDGDVIARVPAHLDPAVEVQPRLGFEEMIPVGRPAGGVGVTVLRQIHQCVRDKVVPAFEDFFAPLPPTIRR